MSPLNPIEGMFIELFSDLEEQKTRRKIKGINQKFDKRLA